MSNADARQQRRDQTTSVLRRILDGKTLHADEAHTLIGCVQAEQIDADHARTVAEGERASADKAWKRAAWLANVSDRQALRLRTARQQRNKARDERDEARELAINARNIHEGARLTLADALGHRPDAEWSDLISTARGCRDSRQRWKAAAFEQQERAVAAEKARADTLGDEFRTRRHDLAAALGLGTDARWDYITDHARQLVKAIAAERAAHGLHRHDLAGELDLPTDASWSDISLRIRTLRRDLADAENRADGRTEAAEKWKTHAVQRRQRAEAAERRAVLAEKALHRTMADWRRAYHAWRNARRRAAALSAELTRRAPLTGEYANHAEAAERTLARVRAELDRITALPTVNRDDYADSFATGARWTARQIRDATCAQAESTATLSSRLCRMLGKEQGASDDVLIEAVRGLLVRDAQREQPEPVTDDPNRIVAYEDDDHPGQLYCRRHGDVSGATPRTADDLPDGGICHACGADVLIEPAPEKPTSPTGPEAHVHVTVTPAQVRDAVRHICNGRLNPWDVRR